MSRAFMLAAFLLAAPRQAPVPVVHLSRPSAVLPRDFSQIRGLRELPDGRVLVSDWTDEVVLVADLGRGTVRQIGRKGTGPREYRLPASLIPLPGDSTLLVDQGNERLAIIGPDLEIVRSFSSHRQGLTHTVTPRAVDGAGRFYFEIPNWSRPGADPNDSAVVARWNPATEREEVVGRVKAETWRKPGRRMQPGLPYVIFAPQDVWQVDPAGRIAFVRSGDYHVEWRDPDGRVMRGPRMPVVPLPVRAADRTDYVRRFMMTAPVAGRGSAGMEATPAELSSPEAVARTVPHQEFAKVRPPFTDFTPRIAPDGMLWVERSVPSGGAPTFDLFDSRGVRRRSVVLPAGRRLVAVGTRGAYLAAVDDDGVERLERYVVGGGGATK
jgi:hypothetical protein